MRILLPLLALGLSSLASGQVPNGGPVRDTEFPKPAPLVLEEASRPLLGVPYVLSPLGEGQGEDSDPRFRLDAFDCTTFVETVVALALPGGGRTPAQLEVDPSALDRLRYLPLPEARRHAQPRFEDRAHLIAAQWLPNWQSLGLLEDVTESLVTESARVGLDFDPSVWESRRIARDLELPPEVLPFGPVELPVVPLELAETVLLTAAPGLLINVVRQPSAGVPILISHQALLLDNQNGDRVLRHASQSLGRVADQTPAQFVRVLRSPKQWPVVGVNLQRIQLPAR